MTKRDYYEILNVEKNATSAEIKSAYRKLAREHHPDVNKEQGAEDRFKEITEAYEVLADDRRRQAYDQFGHDAAQSGGVDGDFFGGFGGIGDIFDAFFGGGARSSGMRNLAEDGRDLRIDLEVDLIAALHGIEKEVPFSRLETCETCEGSGAKPGTSPINCEACQGMGQVRHVRNTMLGQVTQVVPCAQCGGMGRIIQEKCSQCHGKQRIERKLKFTVKVPIGVEDGLTMRYPNEGDAGRNGGHAGDLYAVIRVIPSQRFERDGTILYLQQDVPFVKAALGGKVLIKGLDQDHELDLPAGTQADAEFRIPEGGLPPLKGGRRGELRVLVGIKVPKKLNDTQKSLLRQFAAASGEDLEGLSELGEKTFLEKFKERLIKEE